MGNVAHDNCFFCGGDSDCASSNGCCPGCHDSALNCAYPYPICNQDTHRCGCTTNDECNAPDICDNNQCVPPSPCAEDNECEHGITFAMISMTTVTIVVLHQ